jgi:hypothetical protein
MTRGVKYMVYVGVMRKEGNYEWVWGLGRGEGVKGGGGEAHLTALP